MRSELAVILWFNIHVHEKPMLCVAIFPRSNRSRLRFGRDCALPAANGRAPEGLSALALSPFHLCGHKGVPACPHQRIFSRCMQRAVDRYRVHGAQVRDRLRY